MQHVPDPYRALGVSYGATEAQIKAAHRTLAKRYHPDAPTGDTVRFLAVQEAYQLLADPLRRRDWDARHAPGPIRAGTPGTPRPRAANGRWTRAAAPPAASGGAGAGAGAHAGAESRGEAGRAGGPPRSPTGRERQGRGYTWSAADVPWWEEHGPRESRRQPGRKRPHEAPPTGTAAGSGSSHAAGPGRPPGAREADTDTEAGRPHAAPDFDVYNRSSGAAWSSAARAYFRRADAELPRRGSFQHQGTQPLTAARARVAAEEQARRNGGRAAQAGQPQAAEPQAGRRHNPRQPASDASARAARPSQPAAAAPAARPTSARPQPPKSGQPAFAWAGVTRDATSIARARAGARAAARAARWPGVPERLAYALVAWVPIAVVIGYAGAGVTGCDRAAVGCPPHLETAQSVLIALSLGLLAALPRLAYTAAVASLGLGVAAIAIVIGAWFLGVETPLSTAEVVVVGVLLGVAYLATASWALADGPRRRPWLPERRAYREAYREGHR